MISKAGTPTTSPVKVWDLPIRITHWLLVFLFGLLWWSGENHVEQVHFLAGYAMVAVLIFRLLWGFVGSSTARFHYFVRGPRGLLGYLSHGRNWSKIGHTPLGALSVVVMLTLLIAQVAMGLIQAEEEDGAIVGGPLSHLVDPTTASLAHELHESIFSLLLYFVALHIGAILFHRIVRGRRLTRAMITGRDEYPQGTKPMRGVGAARALLCIAVAVVLTGWIVAGLPPLGA